MLASKTTSSLNSSVPSTISSSSKGQLEFKYVPERYRISNLCSAKYALKICTLTKLWAEMLFRFQLQMVMWLFELRYGPGIVSLFKLKNNSFREKNNKKLENKYTKKHSFDLSKSWKKKYFDSIIYENPKT